MIRPWPVSMVARASPWSGLGLSVWPPGPALGQALACQYGLPGQPLVRPWPVSMIPQAISWSGRGLSVWLPGPALSQVVACKYGHPSRPAFLIFSCWTMKKFSAAPNIPITLPIPPVANCQPGSGDFVCCNLIDWLVWYVRRTIPTTRFCIFSGACSMACLYTNGEHHKHSVSIIFM